MRTFNRNTSQVQESDAVRQGPRVATARQREVLRLVWGGATLRQVGSALGIGSTNGVNDHLMALERKGLVEHAGHGLAHPWTVTLAGLAELGLRRCGACKGEGAVAC